MLHIVFYWLYIRLIQFIYYFERFRSIHFVFQKMTSKTVMDRTISYIWMNALVTETRINLGLSLFIFHEKTYKVNKSSYHIFYKLECKKLLNVICINPSVEFCNQPSNNMKVL